MIKNPKFIYCFLPVIILLVIQLIVSVVASVYLSSSIFSAGVEDYEDFINKVIDSFDTPDYIIGISLVYNIIAIVIFAIWYYKLRKYEKATFEGAMENNPSGSKPVIWMVIFGIILITIGCQYVGAFIAEIMAMAFPALLAEYADIMGTAGIAVTGDTAYSITPAIALFTVVAAPLAEELCYRGLCMSYAMKKLPLWGANILAAVLFGIMHGNLFQGIFTFAFALVLGYIYGKTRNLIITIVIHLLYNGISLAAPWMVYIGSGPVQWFLIVLASLCVAYLGLSLILRGYGKKIGQ